ncbi:MAG: hypothetical protein Q8M40_12845 [Legionella sp.]|nr:hypothetical protein [Legionella sp.]
MTKQTKAKKEKDKVKNTDLSTVSGGSPTSNRNPPRNRNNEDIPLAPKPNRGPFSR